MDDFETQVRAALASHADEAGIQAGITQRAETGAARHRMRARLAAGGAALAVAAVVVGTAVVLRPSTDAGAPLADRPNESVTDAGQGTPDGWRTEVWHDVAVDVPADWGYNAGIQDGSTWCGDGPVDADGQRAKDVAGWVGRPVMLSDMCMGDPDYLLRELAGAPFVMFDTGLEVGSQSVGDGFTVETIAIDDLVDGIFPAAGNTVTVGWSDRAQRDQIVASIRANDSGCRSTLGAVPDGLSELTTEGAGQAISARWCLYNRGAVGFNLMAAGVADPQRSQDAWYAGLEAPLAGYPVGEDPDQFLVLSITSRDPFGTDVLDQAVVYDFANGTIDFGDVQGRATRTRITEDAIEPIWNGALRTTVWSLGTNASWTYAYAIGPQG